MAWLPLPGPLSDYRQHQQEFNKGMFSKLLGMQIQKHLKEQDMENEMQRHAQDVQLKRMQLAHTQGVAGAKAAEAARKQSIMQDLLSQFMGGQQPQPDDMLAAEGGGIRPPSLQFAQSPGFGGVPSPDASLAPSPMSEAPPQIAPSSPTAMQSMMQPEQPIAAPANRTEAMYQRFKQLDPMQQQMLKQAFKSQLGFVPFEPLEKREQEQAKKDAEFEMFKRKEQFKAESKKGEADKPTTRFATVLQQSVSGIDSAIPMLEKIKELDVPFQGHIKLPHTSFIDLQADIPVADVWSPNKQRVYEAHTAAITDSLLSALQVPKTNESIELVNKMVKRGTFEGEKAYKKRVDNLIEDLKQRKVRYQETLKKGVQSSLMYNPETGDFE